MRRKGGIGRDGSRLDSSISLSASLESSSLDLWMFGLGRSVWLFKGMGSGGLEHGGGCMEIFEIREFRGSLVDL